MGNHSMSGHVTHDAELLGGLVVGDKMDSGHFAACSQYDCKSAPSIVDEPFHSNGIHLHRRALSERRLLMTES